MFRVAIYPLRLSRHCEERSDMAIPIAPRHSEGAKRVEESPVYFRAGCPVRSLHALRLVGMTRGFCTTAKKQLAVVWFSR